MLLAATGDLVLLGLVAGLSPIPAVAAVLAAGAPNPATGPAFAFGWVAGLGALTAILAFAAGEIDPTNLALDAGVQVLVGAALLLAALRKWRARPRGDAPVLPPRWMSSLQDGPTRGFGLGAALGGLNPKHLALAAAAAATMHYHGLFGPQAALAAVLFTAAGSCTVIAIALAGALGGPRSTRALEALKRFMLRHNSVIMMALFALVGAKLLSDGLLVLLR
jgi:hypothetical protein